jgi:hypothetical protein
MLDRQQFLALLFVLSSVCAFNVASAQDANNELSRELKQRGLVDGLALVRATAGNRWEVVPLNGEPRMIDNPRGLSGAWFAGNGSTVAWNIASWPNEGFAACPSPVIIEDSDGTKLWQLPGNVINSSALAVSTDGRRVAFDGTLFIGLLMQTMSCLRNLDPDGFHYAALRRSWWCTGFETGQAHPFINSGI